MTATNTPTTHDPLTVEAALAELAEMFAGEVFPPYITAKFDRDWRPVFSINWVVGGVGHYLEGATLGEVMATVRHWQEEQHGR